MDIWVYTWEFELLHIEPRYISANWTIHYNGIGTFEGRFGLDSEIVPIVMQNKYLVVKQGTKTAIVTGTIINNDLAVFGRTCNWLLTRRTTPNFKSINGNVQTLTRNIVSTAFSDVSNFNLGEIISWQTKTIDFWRNTYNPTADVVKECLDNDGAGHEVVFDTLNKQWIYRVMHGNELPLIVSEANKNAYDTQINEDILDFYTAGYYEKQPEDTEAESEWIYISGEKTGIYKWECRLNGGNLSEARTDLNNKKAVSETSLKSYNLKFGIDYELGDIVRVQIQKGQYRTTVKKRITGVNIWYEQASTGEQPIFEDLEE